MSGGLSDRQRDRLLAVGAAVFAGSLITGARTLEDSMLSDAVGAGGVPQGVGIAIAVAAVALFAKSFIVGKAEAAAAPEEEDDGGEPAWTAVAARTGGLVAILVAYGLLLPWLGYPLTVSLLVLASGRLAGAPLALPLLLCALFSGPLLWAMFDWALQVRMPVGSLWA